jgi:hypothetical protein
MRYLLRLCNGRDGPPYVQRLEIYHLQYLHGEGQL